MFNDFYKKIFSLFSGFSCTALFVFAVMGSTNYSIQSDSINFGGGSSGSTNYGMESTLGEVGTGNSSSANYQMNAGYQQMQLTYIAITSPSDDTLSSINGLLGGASASSVTWNVTTDNAAGYSLSVRASTSPALKGPNGSFADYVPAGANPDYNFTTAASESRFGFSPESTDIISRYKDNGTQCNTGALDTSERCWDGFSTSNKLISQNNSSNHPSGSNTTLRYRAEVGASKTQDSGTYSAEIIVTALVL